MITRSCRLIVAVLFVLLANPACCCRLEGAESTPQCCQPTDAGDEGQPDNTDPDGDGCGGCQCGKRVSAPLQATLFEMAPDSQVASLIDFTIQLANFNPAILTAISEDLTLHSLKKKQQRLDHKRWIEEKTGTLVDVPQTEAR